VLEARHADDAFGITGRGRIAPGQAAGLGASRVDATH
jgi:hypothetical protein